MPPAVLADITTARTHVVAHEARVVQPRSLIDDGAVSLLSKRVAGERSDIHEASYARPLRLAQQVLRAPHVDSIENLLRGRGRRSDQVKDDLDAFGNAPQAARLTDVSETHVGARRLQRGGTLGGTRQDSHAMAAPEQCPRQVQAYESRRPGHQCLHEPVSRSAAGGCTAGQIERSTLTACVPSTGPTGAG